TMSLREHALSLFRGALGTVRPAPMLRRALKLQGDGCPHLLVKGQAFAVKRGLYLVGFGKAVLGMAAAAEEILGDHLTRGIINVPLGIQESLQRAGMQEMLLKPHSKIQVIEGAKNNLPDAEALKGAAAIQELAEGLTADDLLLVLISGGGGSALLPAPIPPILLEDKEKLTKMLASRGAAIQELNIVRKTLSVLKGGGLAQLAHPAQVVSLILSDVIGDPLDIIASGPTAASSHSVQDCLHILTKYNLLHNLPKSVEMVLSSSPIKPTAPENYSHVSNIILGSNTLALEEARRQAEGLGYAALVLSAAVCGEVGHVATLYCQLIQLVCLGFASLGEGPLSDELRGNLLQLAAELQIPVDLNEFLQALQGLGPDRPVCILAGGETTVQLQGTGKGGRNQELALRVGLGLHKAQATGASSPQGRCEILFLSGGTDGQDGPTEAAGAFCSPGLVAEALQEGLDVEAFLRNNDSYTFFSHFQGGHHLLVTGLTGTNVMDIQAILIRAM
ncbi:GLCTK kinase, partial [Urocynchramus pylzowi]|nr:GLCTK kinase [Urocynchramus pylzowi]